MQPTVVRPRIIPSVLPADFSRPGDECVALEQAGADRIQRDWDVMDGSFVPNTTVGPDLGPVDLVLVTRANPGFGGQDHPASMEKKIAEVHSLVQDQPHEIELEVDGGIGRDTIGRPARAGATAFCVGSALFGHPDRLAGEVAHLRGLAEPARSNSSHDKEAA